MEPTKTAAVTVAPGSVETPGKKATPATRPAAEAKAPQPSNESISRDQRRTRIADWLTKPEATETEVEQGTPVANPEAGDGSQPASEEGSHDDLSKSNPTEGEGEESADDGAEAPEAGAKDAAEETGDTAEKGRWPKEAVERLRKLKDQRKELRGELEKRDQVLQGLQAQIQELKAQVQQPAAAAAKSQSNGALDAETDPGVIRSKAEEAQRATRWAEDLLDEVNDDPEGVAAELKRQGLEEPREGWDPKGLRQAIRGIRDSARKVLEAAPRRMHWLNTEAKALDTAATVEPELVNPKSEIAREVNRILVQRPWLRDQPDWPLLALAGAIGLREIAKRQNGAAAKPEDDDDEAAPVPPPVRRAPRLPGAPRAGVANPASKGHDPIRERAIRSGATREDRRAYVASSLAASWKET